jgi:hypothetical protein
MGEKVSTEIGKGVAFMGATALPAFQRHWLSGRKRGKARTGGLFQCQRLSGIGNRESNHDLQLGVPLVVDGVRKLRLVGAVVFQLLEIGDLHRQAYAQIVRTAREREKRGDFPKVKIRKARP